jgi:hypothetical protein
MPPAQVRRWQVIWKPGKCLWFEVAASMVGIGCVEMMAM